MLLLKWAQSYQRIKMLHQFYMIMMEEKESEECEILNFNEELSSCIFQTDDGVTDSNSMHAFKSGIAVTLKHHL